MKIIKLISISILITLFLSNTAYAAKENYDRSKQKEAKESLMEKNCKGDKEHCKKMMKEKKKKLKNKNKSKSQDYNSSRSNKQGIKQDIGDNKKKKHKMKMKMKDKKAALCDKEKNKDCKEFGQSNKKKDKK